MPIAHGWSGVFAAQRDWKQTVAADPATGLAWAGGYVGVGVCAANLSGRILADLIRGEQSDRVSLPFVNRPQPRDWEPEPLRYIGAQPRLHAVPRRRPRRAPDGQAVTARRSGDPALGLGPSRTRRRVRARRER